jgi:hypothetical protein
MDFLLVEPPIDPNDIIKIEDMVINGGWLLTTFNFLKEKQFQLPTYVLNENVDFRVLLDRNFTSDLVNVFNSVADDSNFNLNAHQKIVAAHQAFFQLSNIISEPNLSYYEYADKNEYNTVSSELDLFRIADNLHVRHWADLALGRKVSIPPAELRPIKGTPFSKKDSRKRLNGFEANFIIIKKAVILKKSGLPNHEVMLELLSWLHKDFLFTAPSVLFLNFYLCPNRPGIKKMIKNYGIEGLRNATWDLTFMQEFVKKIKNEINNKDNQRWLACTNDNAIKKIIPLLFANYEEELSEFQRRLKNAFISSWGKNTGIGEKIYESHCKYFEESDLESRKVNQNNFREHVEKINKELDEELMLLQ